MSEVEQPALEDYPVRVTPGRFELIEGVTFYRFINDSGTSGRWLAVCKVKSSFERRDGSVSSQEKVKIYRWIWKEIRKWNPAERKSVGTGDYGWRQEEVCTPSKKYWDKIKEQVEKYMSEIV